MNQEIEQIQDQELDDQDDQELDDQDQELDDQDQELDDQDQELDDQDQELEEEKKSAYDVMHDMVEFVAKVLASKPDSVTVETRIENKQVIFSLTVAEEDKGKVIGRGGKVAEALRDILRAASVKAHTRAILEIK